MDRERMIPLEVGVAIISVGQLENLYERSDEESVFVFLRNLLQEKPIMLTGDKPFVAYRGKEPPDAK